MFNLTSVPRNDPKAALAAGRQLAANDQYTPDAAHVLLMLQDEWNDELAEELGKLPVTDPTASTPPVRKGGTYADLIKGAGR